MIKSETLLIIGAVVAGGYVIYKLTEPLTKTTEQVGGAVGGIAQSGANVVERGGEAVGSYFDVWNELFDTVKNKVSSMGSEPIKNATLSANNLSISQNANAIARANTSAMFNKATYDSQTGVLIDSSGKGYSVRPDEVPNVLAKIKTGIQAPTLKKDGSISKLKPALFAVTKK